MIYDQVSQFRIEQRLRVLHQVEAELLRRLSSLRSRLTTDVAAEYLFHGVGRRLTIVTRCIVNIFKAYPVDQVGHLGDAALTDATINLHAFVINVSGVLDNLAWVYAHEYALVGDTNDGRLRRKDVGLFSKRLQSYLPEVLREYLRSDEMLDWHVRYSKDYRDALAHRIPLYIPPAVLAPGDQTRYRELEVQMQALTYEDWEIYGDLLEQQRQLGRPSPFFTHSRREESRPMFLHAQVLSDHMTVEALVALFCECMEQQIHHNACSGQARTTGAQDVPPRAGR